ncbi:MAG: hypothetical protein K2R98_12350 [Gemmataceae bacterium]|nr:hypothetical protein [Gemmataceae bacterium]
MADFAIYWKNFARESKAADWPCTRWFTNADRLGKRAVGDRLWLFTAGDKCDMAEAKAGYLVEVFRVKCVQENQVIDPDYPSHEFRYVIQGDETRCVKIDPPLLVDDIIRAEGQDPAVAIGTFLQSPRKLDDDNRNRLLDRLRAQRPELLAEVQLET